MVHETKIGQLNGAPAAPKGIARSVGGLTHDLFTLTELQVQLLFKDLQAGSKRVLSAGLILLTGLVIGLASIPIGLISLALLIRDTFSTTYSLAFLFSALAGVVCSGTLGGIGWLMLRGCSTILQRSNQEFLRNLRWIKKVLERDRSTQNSNQH
ncbi:MAG: phage holin family protein [Pirellula sp.]|nr:phage holin family protein [Pirellula sp.]